MRIAVLVKQVPLHEDLHFDHGRLVREGTRLEVSAYCRRANAKAVELAGDEGEVVVFTMGPPAAEDALREMVASGADRGVHLCDPVLAGSDTLATARALAAAIRLAGQFDLVLTGLSSVDADTGQVGAEVAELLGLPFAAGARELTVDGGRFHARLETDFGYREVAGALPAVLSCAERLTSPSKANSDRRALVDGSRLTTLGMTDLGLLATEVGAAGSPTTVGALRVVTTSRRRERAETVAAALARIRELGGLDVRTDRPSTAVPPTGDGPRAVWCFARSYDEPWSGALLGEAATLAAEAGGTVTAFTPSSPAQNLGPLGADRVLTIPGNPEPERWARAIGEAAAAERPWALLVEGTPDGRSVAAAVAARFGWGLIGDAVGLEYRDGRLAAWKPAFAGDVQALIESSSPVQMVTVRPGVLPLRRERPATSTVCSALAIGAPARITTLAEEHLGDAATLLAATRVVGVGAGVDPAHYPLVEQLCDLLGAQLAATRKVTDQGRLPRSRQVGLTGHAVAPQLYVALGTSGRYNHSIGFRHAQHVLAINNDPNAAVFDAADVGAVGDCETAIKELIEELAVPVQHE